jgi:hypothetical protein
VVLRHFHRNCPRAARCGSLIEGIRSLGFTWLGSPERNTLRQWEMCVLLCVLPARVWLVRRVLGLSWAWFQSGVVWSLYSTGADNYMYSQGLTGGPRAVMSYYITRGTIASSRCHTRFLCQNRVLIVCMTQDQMFHTYGQKCSQIINCHSIECSCYINNVFKN